MLVDVHFLKFTFNQITTLRINQIEKPQRLLVGNPISYSATQKSIHKYVTLPMCGLSFPLVWASLSACVGSPSHLCQLSFARHVCGLPFPMCVLA